MPGLSELVTDKAFLRSIAANNYRIPDDIDPFDFSLALLQNFATTDAELRDELTYMILAHLIIDEESAHLLTANQRETLVSRHCMLYQLPLHSQSELFAFYLLLTHCKHVTRFN
jgi:hypothetical protein